MFRTIFQTFCFVCLLRFGSCYEDIDGNKSSFIKPRSENSSCQQLGLAGICKRVSNCVVALHELKQGKSHTLRRCGFVDSEEVVCCPDLSDRQVQIQSTTLDSLIIWGRSKSEMMCDKMIRDYNVKPSIDYHVLNGEDAKEGQFPHMAALGFRIDDIMDWKKCGASLISPRFLLTAAHCLICADCVDNPPVKARFGVIDIRDDAAAQDVDIKKTLPHEEYDHNTRHNDIALIELVKDVQITKTIYPACLHVDPTDPKGMQVTGWGQTVANNVNSLSDILQYAVVEPVGVNQCNMSIVQRNQNSAKVILRSQICAISKADSCAGDSGGPLQWQRRKGGYNIVGVVSYGVGCGSSVPGIYTRVSAYLNWIEEKVWPT